MGQRVEAQLNPLLLSQQDTTAVCHNSETLNHASLGNMAIMEFSGFVFLENALPRINQHSNVSLQVIGNFQVIVLIDDEGFRRQNIVYS